jgi:hypothetical protein
MNLPPWLRVAGIFSIPICCCGTGGAASDITVSAGGAPPPSIVVVLQAEIFTIFIFVIKKIMFCFEEREKGVNVLMK